jgi:hypothetical protein
MSVDESAGESDEQIPEFDELLPPSPSESPLLNSYSSPKFPASTGKKYPKIDLSVHQSQSEQFSPCDHVVLLSKTAELAAVAAEAPKLESLALNSVFSCPDFSALGSAKTCETGYVHLFYVVQN